MIMNTRLILRRSGLFLLTTITLILLSPKWVFPAAAWFAPFLIILFIARQVPWKAYALAVLTLFASSLISLHNVMPFPGVFFPIMTFVISVQAAIPFLVNRVLYPRIQNWSKTLVFPFALVILEYVTSFGGGGTWSSISYTQVTNSFLIQAVSLGGIWIISFVIGWFASLIFYVLEQRWNWHVVKVPVTSFSVLIVALTLFGFVKTNSFFQPKRNTVRVAGITTSNVPLLQTMYEDAFGNFVEVSEDDLTQNSPELAELNKGFSEFVRDPDQERFIRTRLKIRECQDSLFNLSRKEAQAGSKIISWSEAAVFTINVEEGELFTKGQAFARDNKVYFLMTVASIIPGKIEFGKKFIENKALLFDPEGNTINVFFKNRPVPLVEPSVQGDQNIPVTLTNYGKLAISICYDADFPQLMGQMGKKGADILLLPSGDWKEVSPYHARMAIVRAIENGTSLLRPVSGAVSIACDYHGNIVAQRNYFDKGERVVVAFLSVEGIGTLYSIVGDSFAWICIVGLAALLASIVLRYARPGVIITSIQ
jgi:apolipoprotein N-acyltransferase